MHEMPSRPERLLHPADVASRLSVTERTLHRWRGTGQGPKFVRTPGNHVRYREADVDAWVLAR